MTDFFSKCKTILRYLLAAVPVMIVLAGGVFLAVLGVKGIKVGGLIDKLLGKSEAERHRANTIPDGRVDSKGNPLPEGTPDKNGMTQAPVGTVEVGKNGKLEVEAPGDKSPVEVEIPVGEKESDVDVVVVAEPEIHTVEVKPPSSNPVTVEKLDDILKKYGD